MLNGGGGCRNHRCRHVCVKNVVCICHFARWQTTAELFTTVTIGMTRPLTRAFDDTSILTLALLKVPPGVFAIMQLTSGVYFETMQSPQLLSHFLFRIFLVEGCRSPRCHFLFKPSTFPTNLAMWRCKTEWLFHLCALQLFQEPPPSIRVCISVCI